MTDPMTLADALEQETDTDFCYALLEATPAYDGMPFHERPEPVGMLGQLATFYLDAYHEGIWKFLAQHEGDAFEETRGWCAKVGAKGAMAYLDAVAALFPDGKVSRDGAKRDRTLSRLDRRPGGDPLYALDEKFRPSLDKLIVALRRYVKKHRVVLQQACSSKPATPQPSVNERLESALGEIERLGAQMLAEQMALQAKAKARGIRKLDGKADPRMLAFFRALGRLSVDDWREIARRALATKAKIWWGRQLASDISLDLGRGNMIPRAAHQKSIHRPAMEARDRFLEGVVKKLPASWGRGEQSIPLRETIEQLVLSVTIVLMTYDWLMVAPQGAKAAANVFSPFEGFVKIPESPPAKKPRVPRVVR